MKKVFLVIVLALTSVSFLSAQNNIDVKGTYNEVKSQVKASTPRAIGANLGFTNGFSYQQSLNGGKNMLDIAVYASIPLPFLKVNSWGASATITYDWINPGHTQIPWDYKGEWNWAAGFGLAGGVNFKDPFGGHVGVAGHVGIAYDFWFPLELSLDYRPEIGPAITKNGLDIYADGFMNITLGVRYLF